MGQEDLISGAVQKPPLPQPEQKSGISWITILIILIAVAAVAVGIYFLAKGVDKGTEEVLQTSMSQLDSAKDTKAAADLNSIDTALTMYRNQNEKYPIASSYNSMVEILDDLMSTKIEPPSDAYQYKYCSSDGSEYKLEVNQSTNISIIKGSDSCTPE